MQSFEIWQLIPDPPEFLHGAWALHLGSNHLLIVCDGQFSNTMCPVLEFGPVVAIKVDEDGRSDWEAGLEATRPMGKPFLRVAESKWAASTRDYGDPLLHFCIISGDCCVEILADREPKLHWVSPGTVDSYFDTGLQQLRPN